MLADVSRGLPFQSAFFDAVFGGEIIEHQIDDQYFLEECNRVLRAEGIQVLTTPNLVSLGNRFLMFLGKPP
ncbi:MAG: putative S-adenosylmethionine-dependent methyltransferase [Syntrophomonadaceae bacterium]|nr:putative S-adenosylmethionine-dependent methyltransferase [Bacillota bacterium]